MTKLNQCLLGDAIGLLLVCAFLLACGCRSAGPMVRLEGCSNCPVNVNARADAQMGKTVTPKTDVKGLPGP